MYEIIWQDRRSTRRMSTFLLHTLRFRLDNPSML
nr:MAG TPA: hypothetical protein [Bacteriophage sp.]